ncbi:hypothetical protein KA005_32055, partial [bacterium]|nr:hypothetical protein [bacterium]
DIQVKYQLGEFKELAKEAGNFCEGILMALWYLNSKKEFPTGISHFKTDSDELMQNKLVDENTATKDEIIRDEIIRVIIPRVLYSLFTLRNKKQAAHLRGIEIDQFDALYLIQGCSWALAELLWLCSMTTDKQALELIQNVIEIPSPRLEVFDEEEVLDVSGITPELGLLYIICRNENTMKQSQAIGILARSFRMGRKKTYEIRDDAIADGLIHRTEKNILHIRAKGKSLLKTEIKP